MNDNMKEREITELMVDAILDVFKNYKRILSDDCDMVNDESFEFIIKVYNEAKKL